MGKLFCRMASFLHGKRRKQCLRIELLCDNKLSIWHVIFGTFGLKNDVATMVHDNLFSDIRNKKWPPVLSKCVVEGVKLEYVVLFGGWNLSNVPVLRFYSPTSAVEKKQDVRSTTFFGQESDRETVWCFVWTVPYALKEVKNAVREGDADCCEGVLHSAQHDGGRARLRRQDQIEERTGRT